MSSGVLYIGHVLEINIMTSIQKTKRWILY